MNITVYKSIDRRNVYSKDFLNLLSLGTFKCYLICELKGYIYIQNSIRRDYYNVIISFKIKSPLPSALQKSLKKLKQHISILYQFNYVTP